MVLPLDDAQRADVSTAAAVGYLQRGLGDDAVTIVVAYDPEELNADDPLQSLDAAQTIKLGPWPGGPCTLGHGRPLNAHRRAPTIRGGLCRR